MPRHTIPQTHDPMVIQAIIQVGRSRRLIDDQIVVALAVGLVESNLNNLSWGDGSSVGWRQEVARYYGSVENRMDVNASVNRFYSELLRTPRRNRTLGLWGQAVQRSAHPERYDQHIGEARRILSENNH